MITLQFSAQNKPASWLIRKFTWSPFSHVDFVLPDGRLLGSRGDGVKIRMPSPSARAIRFSVDASQDVIAYARTQIGKPYDWGAILGFVAKHNWQDKEAWFCSELVAWSFEQAGAPLLRTRHVYRITPRDLLLSPFLQATGE